MSDTVSRTRKKFSNFRLGWVKRLHLNGNTIARPLFSAFMTANRRCGTTKDSTLVLKLSEVVPYWSADGKNATLKLSFSLSDGIRVWGWLQKHESPLDRRAGVRIGMSGSLCEDRHGPVDGCASLFRGDGQVASGRFQVVGDIRNATLVVAGRVQNENRPTRNKGVRRRECNITATL